MFLPELTRLRSPKGAEAPAGIGRARQRDGWQATRLRYKGTAKNTLAEPDPLKRLAPAGNGIVFQRALSGIVRGKTVSLMLLPTGQMVSEPRQAEQPACLLCEGHARGAGEGSCFNFTVICCLWCREPACHGQLAAPDKCLGRVPRTRGTKLNFHLVIAFPRRHSSCAIVPLCNCGETCTKETCRTHERPAVEPRSLLSRGRVAQCQPLSPALNRTASLTPNPPCGERQHHQSRSERGWVQGQPPGEMGAREGLSSSPASSHWSPSILEESRPSLATSHFSPSTPRGCCNSYMPLE